MRYPIALVFVAISLAAACTGPRSSEPSTQVQIATTKTVQLGEPFDLRIGGAADIEGTGLRATLSTIENDSRCPVDVVCVWEGDAVARVRLERGGRTATAELHLTPRATALQEVEFDGYVVGFNALAPAPHSAVRFGLDAYVATLIVREK